MFPFNLIFSVNFIVTLLAIIGLWALSIFLYDNFKSIVCIIASVLRPFFQPQESKSLAEKFGGWAGNYLNGNGERFRFLIYKFLLFWVFLNHPHTLTHRYALTQPYSLIRVVLCVYVRILHMLIACNRHLQTTKIGFL